MRFGASRLDVSLQSRSILALAPKYDFQKVILPKQTLFDLLTSLCLDMTPKAEKEPTTRPSDRSRGRVLLIADDRAQFVETLSDRGIDVFGVSNGTAAIVSLTRTRPHLVIADATTPGLRIKELAKMLAQAED